MSEKTINLTRQLRQIRKNQSRRVGLVLAVILMLIGTNLVPLRTKATTLTFTLVGTHPQAAAQSTSTGQQLAALTAYNGKIYAGFGDWNANTGPIAINPFDPTSGTFTGSQLSDPTEAIAVFRTINGKLYAPDIDPKAGESSGGYAMGEPWSHHSPVLVIHMFDMATRTGGSDLWMAGSQTGLQPDDNATVWHSTDNGTTWNIAHQEAGTKVGDYMRYYWMGSLNGRIYVQAEGATSGYHTAQVYDGNSWSSSAIGCRDYPTQFAGKLVCNAQVGSNYGISTFDGSTTTWIGSFVPHPPGGLGFTSRAYSMYVDGSYLYAIINGVIYRTTNLSSWESLGSTPAGVLSIAVLNGYVYLGGSQGHLYRSTTSLTAPSPTPPPTSNGNSSSSSTSSAGSTANSTQKPAAAAGKAGTSTPTSSNGSKTANNASGATPTNQTSASNVQLESVKAQKARSASLQAKVIGAMLLVALLLLLVIMRLMLRKQRFNLEVQAIWQMITRRHPEVMETVQPAISPTTDAALSPPPAVPQSVGAQPGQIVQPHDQNQT